MGQKGRTMPIQELGCKKLPASWMPYPSHPEEMAWVLRAAILSLRTKAMWGGE